MAYACLLNIETRHVLVEKLNIKRIKVIPVNFRPNPDIAGWWYNDLEEDEFLVRDFYNHNDAKLYTFYINHVATRNSRDFYFVMTGGFKESLILKDHCQILK